MSEHEVKVTGAVPSGVDANKLTAQFSKVFKLEENKAKAFLTSGKVRTIGKNLDRARTEKVVAVLSKMGLEAVITPPLDAVEIKKPLAEAQALPTFEAAQTESPPPRANFDSAVIANTANIAKTTAEPLPNEVIPQTVKSNDARDEQPDDGGSYLPDIDQVPIGNGLQWLSAGFEMLKDAPLGWIVATIVALILNGILSSIPIVGPLLGIFSWSILFAGLMLGAHRQTEGESFSAFSFMLGLSAKPMQLALVGLFYLIAVVAIVLVIGGMIYGLTLLSGGELGGLTITLIVSLCMMPPIMIIMFAPTLVAVNGLTAVQACKLSVDGGLKNLLPFALYLFGSFIVMLLGILLFGIGFFVAFPIVMASMYAAYRDIFI